MWRLSRVRPQRVLCSRAEGPLWPRFVSNHLERHLPRRRPELVIELGQVLAGEADLECPSVLPHVIGVAAFRDGEDALLSEDPCKRDLRRGCGPSPGDAPYHRLLQQAALF